MQGIPQHQANCPVNCIPLPDYFVFKNENIKVKVKYGFDLHTDWFSGFTSRMDWTPFLL